MAEPKKCIQCKEPAVVSSRCFYHWVKRLGLNRGLTKYAWFSKKLPKIVNMLSGRYLLIRNGGGNPPDLNESMHRLWTTDPRPFWLTHLRTHSHGKNQPVVERGTSHKAFLDLVATVEQKAREER